MIATDDDTRANFIGNHDATFDSDGPYGDYDPMYADAPGDYAPKCGGCWQMGEGQPAGPGCRHCSPPDREGIATGFEIWERPDFYRVRAELQETAKLGYSHPAYDDVNMNPTPFFCRLIGHNKRLYVAAVRKLDIICDEAETHAEAIERYAEWSRLARLARLKESR